MSKTTLELLRTLKMVLLEILLVSKITLVSGPMMPSDKIHMLFMDYKQQIVVSLLSEYLFRLRKVYLVMALLLKPKELAPTIMLMYILSLIQLDLAVRPMNGFTSMASLESKKNYFGQQNPQTAPIISQLEWKNNQAPESLT